MTHVLHPSLVLIIASLLYCVVNASLLAVFFNYQFKLNRFRFFFDQAFAKTVISLSMLLFSQGLFFIYYCRVQRLAENFVTSVTERCPAIDRVEMLVHSTLFASIAVATFAAAIQFFMLRTVYEHIYDTTLFRNLIISNAVACLAKYALVQLLW